MQKILIIIENDVFMGDAMIRRLQDANYHVELVRDGVDGIEKIKKEKPSLVIIDTNLPDMSAEEVLKKKFGDSTISDIPTIVITNSDDSSEIDKIFSLGVRDYIVKSKFQPETLVDMIRNQLSGDVHMSQKKPMAVSEAKKPVDASVTPPLAGKKIMWVEDDAFLSEIIARKLATQGCTLYHAGSGEEALPLLEKTNPDIILLDIMLPGMDGFEILRRVKEMPSAKAIPVLLLSNLGQKSDVEKGEKLGAEQFLIKATVSLDEIIAEIKKVIEKYTKK